MWHFSDNHVNLQILKALRLFRARASDGVGRLVGAGCAPIMG